MNSSDLKSILFDSARYEKSKMAAPMSNTKADENLEFLAIFQWNSPKKWLFVHGLNPLEAVPLANISSNFVKIFIVHQLRIFAQSCRSWWRKFLIY